MKLLYFTNKLCWITKDYFECTGDYPSTKTIQKLLQCSQKEAYDLINTMKAIEILNSIPIVILTDEAEKRVREMLEQKFQ